MGPMEGHTWCEQAQSAWHGPSGHSSPHTFTRWSLWHWEGLELGRARNPWHSCWAQPPGLNSASSLLPCAASPAGSVQVPLLASRGLPLSQTLPHTATLGWRSLSGPPLGGPREECAFRGACQP